MWAFFKGDFEDEENGPKPLRLSSFLITSVRGKKPSSSNLESDADAIAK
jgi:hypothetical protein